MSILHNMIYTSPENRNEEHLEPNITSNIVVKRYCTTLYRLMGLETV